MSHNIVKDRSLTHSIINLLFSEYQGKLAYHNALLKFRHKNANQTSADITARELSRIQQWMSDLWKDNPVFRADWIHPESVEALRAIKLMLELKPELYDLANNIVQMIAQPDLLARREDMQYLAAAFEWYTYSRAAYLYGCVEFGVKFDFLNEVEQYSPLIESAQDEAKLSSQIVEQLAQGTSLNLDFLKDLVEHTFPLSGVFRTHVHEINQQFARYQNGLSYELADFSPEEAAKWIEADFNPKDAGYWRANSFNPEAARKWSNFNITPAIAMVWAYHGFAPDEAALWINRDVHPLEARRQMNET